MKSIILKLLQASGLDVKRYNIANSEWLRMLRTLERHRVTTTLDVGANKGQFASKLRHAGFTGRIISFEPQSGAHSQLSLSASGDPKWVIAPQLALGEREGVVKINLSENSASSSILPIMDSHLNAEPISRYVGTEEVRCSTLDRVAPDFIRPSEVIFLKLDVQGYELHVLRGAESVLGQVSCVRLELSLVPLYGGQLLYAEMIEYMKGKGFTLWGLDPGFTDPGSGKMLQVDGTFCRE